MNAPMALQRPRHAAPTSNAPKVLRAVGSRPMRWWLRLDVEGANLMPAQGPVIVASTHASHADTLALAAAAPRTLTFLGSDHLPRLLVHLGMLPVARGSADAAALHRCLEALEGGVALVIYPEGGRSRDGRVYRPRSGVARLAAAMSCPVVPVGVTGTAEVWQPDGRPRLHRRGHVTVRFGAPLAVRDASPAARREFNDALHASLVRLSGKPSAGVLLPSTPQPERNGESDVAR